MVIILLFLAATSALVVLTGLRFDYAGSLLCILGGLLFLGWAWWLGRLVASEPPQ